MIYRTYWLYMSSMSWPIYIEFFDTLGYVVGLPSIYHLPVVTPSFCSSGSGCGCITVLHLHLEASAEEGAAAAVVRPDQYQQVRSGSNASLFPYGTVHQPLHVTVQQYSTVKYSTVHYYILFIPRRTKLVIKLLFSLPFYSKLWQRFHLRN